MTPPWGRVRIGAPVCALVACFAASCGGADVPGTAAEVAPLMVVEGSAIRAVAYTDEVTMLERAPLADALPDVFASWPIVLDPQRDGWTFTASAVNVGGEAITLQVTARGDLLQLDPPANGTYVVYVDALSEHSEATSARYVFRWHVRS